MNYDEMILAHDRWKIRLRNAITKNEQIDATLVGKDDQCELGKWIYGDGKKYATSDAYKDLKIKHAKFHAAVSQVIIQAKTIPSAQALGLIDPLKSEFSRASSDCINAISGFKALLGK
jgi:hypothetical protein